MSRKPENIARPGQQAGDVGGEDGPVAQHRELDERLVDALLDRHQAASSATRRRAARRWPVSPAQLRRLRDAEQQQREGAGQQQRPVQSIRMPLVRAVRGTTRWAPTAAGTATRLIQNTTEGWVWSTITPDSGSPMPAPTPNTELIRLIAPGRAPSGRCRG
jgi:hypothetical protein